jgi:hypothetical protein
MEESSEKCDEETCTYFRNMTDNKACRPHSRIHYLILINWSDAILTRAMIYVLVLLFIFIKDMD